MSHYKSNVRDVEFNLFEVFGRQEILGKAPFDEVDEETARDMLAEVNRLATGPLAASSTTQSVTPLASQSTPRGALTLATYTGVPPA